MPAWTEMLGNRTVGGEEPSKIHKEEESRASGQLGGELSTLCYRSQSAQKNEPPFSLISQRDTN
jgi:hypothetical protein